MGRYPGEGNYLRKSRKTFYLSKDCRDYILELAVNFGVPQTSIIELAIREKYDRDIREGEKHRPGDLRRVK